MNKISRFTILFFLHYGYSLTAQQGWWTWMKGPVATDQNATWGTQGIPAMANNPAASYGAFRWTDSNEKFWLWGGSNRTGRGQADMWMFDPQTNMWTWKHGFQGLNSLSTSVGIGVPSPTNVPAARQFGGASWVDAQNNLWLFGGDGWAPGNQNGTYADLWKFNTTTNEWTWMHGPTGVNQPGSYGTQGVTAPTNYPPGRREATASWVDKTGKFWMFGGESFINGNYSLFNDLWMYDPATNMWTWMRGSSTPNSPGNYGTKGVAAATNDPPARAVHSHWIDFNGNLWFFGGGTEGSGPITAKVYNDLWKYTITTNQWTWVRGANVPNPPADPLPPICTATGALEPAARMENRADWVDSCGNFWMFGGVNWKPLGGGLPLFYNDMWFYNVKNNTWTLATPNIPVNFGTMGVTAANRMPGHRSGAVPFHENDNLWMFGGNDTMFSMGTGYVSRRSDMWRFVKDYTCTPSSCFIVTANFNGTNLTGCAPNAVTFNNTSINSNSWHWDFGDGTTSTQQHPIHTYTNPGTYTVVLTAYNLPDSSTFTQISYVTVYNNVTAVFTESDDTLCIGQSVSFANNSTNATSYTWNFGDGNTSVSASPSHTYGATGNFTVTLAGINPGGCNDTTTKNIFVVGAQVNGGASQTISCTNATVQIFANSPTQGISYNWTGNGIVSGNTTPTPTVTQPGTYIVTVTDPVTGCTDTAAVTVIANTLPPNLTGGNPVNLSCIPNTAVITANSTTPNVTYNWSGNGIVSGGITNAPTVNAAGTYTVIVTNPVNGCTSSATVMVTNNNPLPNVTPGNNLVVSSCISISGNISASSTTPNVTYFWQGPGIISGGTTNNPSINALGTYTVTVTDPATGCTNTATVSVSNNAPLPNVNGGPSVLLKCNPNTSVIIATSSSSNVTYSWIGPGIISGGNTASPTVNVAGTYTVIVTNPASGCTNSATVLVNPPPAINATISPNVTINLGENTTLTAGGGVSYNWYHSTGLSNVTGNLTIAAPVQTTTYCVIVTDARGCVDTACTTITVEIPCPTPEGLAVPNAFSPNNDGLNDDFCLQGWTVCLKDFVVIVFNRWGEKVYESKDPNFCWDGKQFGNVMDSQVFVYYIKAKYIDQEEPVVKKGNISLIR